MTTTEPLELKWTGPIARDGGHEWTRKAHGGEKVPFHVVVFRDGNGFTSGLWVCDSDVTTLELAKRRAIRGELGRQSKRLKSASQAIASLTAALMAGNGTPSK